MNYLSQNAAKLLKAIFFSFLFFTSAICDAQYNITAASINDPLIQAGLTPSDVSVIGNAIFTNNLATVTGVTYIDPTTGLPYYIVGDGVSTYFGAVTGLGAGYTYSNPDMILGGGHSLNYVAIVYTAETAGVKSVYVEVQKLQNVGHPIMPYLTASVCNQGVMLSNGTDQADSAHIDMVSTYSAGGTVGDIFMVSWQDEGCNYSVGGVGAKGCWGILSSQWSNCNSSAALHPTGCVNNTAAKDATSSDVALGLNPGSGHYEARFAYVDPSNNELLSNTYDLTSASFGTETSEDNPGSGIIKQPRIDVSDNDMTTSLGYEIAYNYYNGSSNNTWDVKHMNPALAGTGELVTGYYSAANSTSDNDNFSPVVTAGSGAYYTLAYACPNIYEVYANILNFNNSNNVTTTGAGDRKYYEVNKFFNPIPPVALSNDYASVCNMGCRVVPSRVYVCWIDNTYGATDLRIDCKTTSSVGTPSFKPLNVPQETSVKMIKIYPNPTTNYIIVNNPDGEQYFISDVQGRILKQGSLPLETFKVDVSALAAGIYVLTMKNRDRGVYTMKFEKQ